MYRYLTAFLLAGALLAPVALRADDDDRRHVKRYYDPYRRDYHEWNEREERAYRHYLQEQRRSDYHDWRKANANNKEHTGGGAMNIRSGIETIGDVARRLSPGLTR